MFPTSALRNNIGPRHGRHSGEKAMVALNKVDVCAEWPARLSDVRAIAGNAVALSAHESVAPVIEAVRGRTVVLLGSYGRQVA